VNERWRRGTPKAREKRVTFVKEAGRAYIIHETTLSKLLNLEEVRDRGKRKEGGGRRKRDENKGREGKRLHT